MSAVDALAVMDAELAKLESACIAANAIAGPGDEGPGEMSERWIAFNKARACVAELIEASLAFDVAESALAASERPDDPKTPDEWMADSRYRDARDHLRAARARRAAALARAQRSAA